MYLRKILSFLALVPLLLSQPAAAEDMSTRIINGEKSDKGSWPFMVALVSKNRDAYSGQFCGASFLGGRYILTAAHCVDTLEAQDLDAVIGISDLRQKGIAQHRYSIKEVYVHEGYADASPGNDIAILELEKELNYIPVNLADRYLRHNLSIGETLTVMGWGDQDPDPKTTRFKSELYQVDLPLVKQSLCPDPVNQSDNAFCAGYANGGYDSCQGDSGGPIVVANGGTYEQLGIVSWGDGCAEAGNYGVYANVSYFADWISAKRQGLSYRQSEFVGAKTSGSHTHTFFIRNNTDQVINTSGASIQGADASIVKNNCSAITVNGSCEITINYNVSELDFGKVSVSILTDHAQVPRFDLAVSYIGTQRAPAGINEMISFANSGVYSSAKSWVKNGSTLETPALGNNELSQLTITGLPAGRLSFDARISTEPAHDFFSIYVNGHLDDRLSGRGHRELRINLPREKNTVVFEYKKNAFKSAVYDRVAISNLTHSAGGQSIRPDGHSTERSSGDSGGSLNWVSLLSLGMLAFVRRRFKAN